MNDAILKKLFYVINDFTESKCDSCRLDFQTRFLFAKEEYKKEKMYPTYANEKELQGSCIYINDDVNLEGLNDLIVENLFDIRGIMYYGTYSRYNLHYFYILMIPFFRENGALDWSKAKAFEENLAVLTSSSSN